MLKAPIAFVVLWFVIGSSVCALAEEAKPQVKAGELPANNTNYQHTPTQHIPTPQEITEAVTNGVDSATQKYEARHPPPPPDNSTWWFTLFLVIFNGGLVVVGLGQCYLFFHTLRATRNAADAAKQSARIAERALIDLEGPFLYPVIEHDIEADLRSFRLYNHPSSPHTPQRPEIRFKIKNFGRSHAFPQTVTAAFFWGQPEDVHGDPAAGFIFDTLIESGGISGHEIVRKMDNEISGWDDYRDVMNSIVSIYLRGSIVFSDTFGNRYEQTYCLRWGPIANRFMVWGPHRNKRRRISGPQNYED